MEYITKHRILRNESFDANCDKIIKDANEERNVKYILQGLKNVPEWAPFCTILNVQIQNYQQMTMKKLEKLLVNEENKMKAHIE